MEREGAMRRRRVGVEGGRAVTPRDLLDLSERRTDLDEPHDVLVFADRLLRPAGHEGERRGAQVPESGPFGFDEGDHPRVGALGEQGRVELLVQRGEQTRIEVTKRFDHALVDVSRLAQIVLAEPTGGRGVSTQADDGRVPTAALALSVRSALA